MINNELDWFQNWYGQCCKIQDEAKCSITIDTIDNPGWFVTIDIADFSLAAKPLLKVNREYSEHEWIQCWVKDAVFYGVGGPGNLPSVLSTFRLWACNMDYQNVPATSINQLDTDDDFFWLINWRNSQCNGDWEHSFGVHLTTSTDKPGWHLKIDVAETNLERAALEQISAWRSNDDWYSYEVKNSVFAGKGGVENLSDILHGFRAYAKAYKQFNVI